jgi:hypothetical protein
MFLRRRKRKLDDDHWLSAVLAEYNSLREEILESIRVQLAILRFGIAGLVILIGFGTRYTGTDLQLSLAILNFITPAGAAVTLILWQGELERMMRASTFVAHLSAKVNSEMGPRAPALDWELFLRRSSRPRAGRIISAYAPIAFILILLTIVACGIGLRGFWQDHQQRKITGNSMHEYLHHDYALWFWAFTVCDIVIVIGLAIYYKYKSRQIRMTAEIEP